MTISERAVSTGDSPETSNGYTYYALCILTLTFAIDVIDRNILTILMEPIKQELGLSDTQLGIIYGLCFALFFGLFSIPIAMWADRGNRRNIISLAITIFSGMTVLTGFVTNFWHLVLTRFGVAIGEAGSAPLAHSMISDIIPAHKRATALAIFSVGGVNLGTLIGLLAGGWINEWYGWRMAFFVVGIPGLLIAALVRFTLREPVRGHADGLTAQGAEAAPGILSVFKFLWKQRSFRHIAYGAALASTGGNAAFIWIPTYLSRSFGMTSGEIGTALALILGIVGGAGTFFYGYLADRLAKRDIRWNLWIVVVAFVLSFPFWCATYLGDSKYLALGFLLYPAFAVASYMGPSAAMIQSLVTVRMRTQAAAILFLVVNLVGGFVGPQVTGILSDLYHPMLGQESLRYALLTSTVTWIWCGLHFYLATRSLKDDIARARTAS